MHRSVLCFAALPAALLLIACSGAPAQAPTTTTVAQQVADGATATVAPSATPEPTETATTAAPTASATAIAPTPSATPTASPTPQSGLFVFSQQGESSAVVRRNASGGWDDRYVNPGAMVYHEGRFHMFRNGFFNWPGEISFGYMQSENGVTWQPAGDSPLFTSDAVPYAENGAALNAVVVADDGTWMLYFHTLSRPFVIGRATATSPTGPWTVDPQPVLQGGSDGAWDEHGVGWHSVVQTDDGYVMYYAGRQQFTTQIGRATSVDGISWTKYDDPQTTAPPFAESDPVLPPTQEWERGDVDRPEARLTPDGWVMMYVGNDLNNRGLALSEDGIHWTPVAENPVMTSSDFPITGSTWDTSLLFHEGTYYYFMEIGNLAGTDIYLARHEGAIEP